MRDTGLYKRVIDRLVHSCLHGQGAIGPMRVRRGLWNQNATAESTGMADQHRINLLLARLSSDDREVVAGMLADAFESGVHDSLVVLYEEGVTPFDDGYVGDPFHDFIGRLADWAWPDEEPAESD